MADRKLFDSRDYFPKSTAHIPSVDYSQFSLISSVTTPMKSSRPPFIANCDGCPGSNPKPNSHFTIPVQYGTQSALNRTNYKL